MPFRFAIEAAYFLIAGVGGRSPPPLRAASLPMMRRAESHTASIAPIVSCLPVSTSSSRHSISAVTPGSTSPGSARSRTPNRASPRSVGTMFLPCAARNPCLFSPAMISARVAGVPIPYASFSRSRRPSSPTKRQAFCIASISVPSL